LALLGCTEKQEVVDYDYVDMMYIKNSLNYTIKYDLIGTTVEKGAIIRYSKTGEITENMTEHIFDVHSFGDIQIDTVIIYNQSTSIYKVSVPHPYFELCKCEVINEYVQKSLLELTPELLNSN